MLLVKNKFLCGKGHKEKEKNLHSCPNFLWNKNFHKRIGFFSTHNNNWNAFKKVSDSFNLSGMVYSCVPPALIRYSNKKHYLRYQQAETLEPIWMCDHEISDKWTLIEHIVIWAGIAFTVSVIRNQFPSFLQRFYVDKTAVRSHISLIQEVSEAVTPVAIRQSFVMVVWHDEKLRTITSTVGMITQLKKNSKLLKIMYSYLSQRMVDLNYFKLILSNTVASWVSQEFSNRFSSEQTLIYEYKFFWVAFLRQVHDNT